MSEVERVLADSSLPESARERIRGLLHAGHLTGSRAEDVARELTAHFEDGLAAGRSLDELLEAFGADADLATLIARSKSRADNALAADARPARGAPIAALARNLRYAARRMAQTPGFTAIAILSLAIGIGANTAMFTLINETVFRDLPVEDPDELIVIYTSVPDFEYNVFSYPNFRDVRDGTVDLFEGISGSGYAFVSVDGADGVEMLAAEAVSGEYFPMLGIQAEVGRLLDRQDDVAKDAHPVAVLGHGYWQRAFAGDPDVVGRGLRINGMEYVIVGVAPESYPGNLPAFSPDLFVPVLMMNQLQPSNFDRLEQRSAGWLFTRARLRDGVTLQEVEGRLATIGEQLGIDYPDDWDSGYSFLVYRNNDIIIWPPIDRILIPAAGVFMSLVGLVLLVACANLASFLLARAMDRQKEIAVRLALGATRRSIVGQLLTETLLLSFLGGAAGIGVSIWLLDLVFTFDLPLPFPISVDVVPDGRVLAFSLALSVGAGLLFGVAPALQGVRGDVAATLKEGGSGAGRPRRVSLRNSLVVAQVALCLVLLVAAGLFVRSAIATQSIDPGFGTDPAGVVTVVLPGEYTSEEGWQLVRRLQERFAELPGVDAVGMIDNLHLTLTNTQFMYINVDGFEPPAGSNGHVADRATVDAGFFDAAGVQIVSGRAFNAGDTADSEPVAIVSEALAEKFWPGESALGRVLRQARQGRPDLTIVGVARDTKVRTIAEQPISFVYTPFSQTYTPFITFVARTAAAAGVTARDMLRAGRAEHPELMVFETKTMAEHISVQMLPARMAAVVLAAFAALTLALASIGLYGVVSYAVAQRTREMGIRISLGAEGRDVVTLLTGGGMRLVAIGATVGLGLAFAVAQLMGAVLYGVGALDPIVFLGGPIVLSGVALIAAWVPARRASRVDPVVALRAE